MASSEEAPPASDVDEPSPRMAGLPPPLVSTTTTALVMRRYQKIIGLDGDDFDYFKMAKTVSSAPSAGSSRDHQQPSRYRVKAPARHSAPSSSSNAADAAAAAAAADAAAMIAAVTLPQCKVKRNYACSKCAYYTQNPRSFLHHQKNVHAERLKVYECSHCLYASKHSQKLHRHVQMVHQSNKGKHGNSKDKGGGGGADDKQRLLVPPVRIRVLPRQEKYAERQLGQLVIVEDVDVHQQQQQQQQRHQAADEEVAEPEEEDLEADVEAETDGREDELEEMEEEEMVEEEEAEDEEEAEEEEARGGDDAHALDDYSMDVGSSREPSPPPQPPAPAQQPSRAPSAPKHKKQYKVEKQSATFIRCSVCPFGSHSQTLVNRHEKTAHLKKKFFRCMKCNYVTHMRARYTKHVKYHTMPMIKCDDCDFRTPYKWNLDRHNRNHSTVAPGTYKCSHCSFSADIKQSLTVHETNHHVPPVGGVFPVAGAHRRRYRVGASDAPGSSVAGTEIVTYETTKDGGIVEIMTETKSATTTATSGGGGGGSSALSKPSVVAMTPKKTSSAAALTFAAGGHKSDAAAAARAREDGGGGKPNRRPLPKLIPIAEQQQQQKRSMVFRLPKPAAQPAPAAAAGDDYYSNVATGRSALSDFASLIDDQYDPAVSAYNAATAAALVNGAAYPDRRRDGPAAGSGASPKSKTSSFFDKLKAKVDETADLTCPVCRYESKCLSEFMRHQRTHDGYYANDEVDHARSKSLVTSPPPLLELHARPNKQQQQQQQQPPPPPPVTAAELKSTRCQRCRKRCKTSAELVVHLATCRGLGDASAAAVAVSQPAAAEADVDDDDEDDDDENETQQHPMENKIFVWNTAAVSSAPLEDEDDGQSITVTPVAADVTATAVEEPALSVPEQRNEDEEEDDDDEEDLHNEYYPSAAMLLKQQQQQQQLHQHIIRREGKMYKTVFKCPHCTFWAATASRFHVHIVGHLNRKPFECSCCAYRSNWRWDITKHIRLKSARRSGGADEHSAAAANSHIGAKVLMTDETGRRNYSKYNRYLQVMEMDIADGADKAAGGDCEDGKGVAGRKSVGGGGVTRKRRTAASATAVGKGGQAPPSVLGKQPPVLQALTSKNFKTGTAAVVVNRNGGTAKPTAPQQQQQQQQQQQRPASTASSGSGDGAGGDSRSKTMWKCKKCMFRNSDRLTVLNHVKAHYRRGEFSGNGSPASSWQNTSQRSNANDAAATSTTTPVANAASNKNHNNVEAKKSTDVDERRKTKMPITGTTADSLLMLSTNPKSRMLYDADNFLSCPLCDLTASNPGELKEHMENTHIPEETKYRCEYCPFWSEEKKIMLDHMMFAHEMDDGSVNTDVNAADVADRNEQQRRDDYDYDETGGGGTMGSGWPGEFGSDGVAAGHGDDEDEDEDEDEMTTAGGNVEVVFDTSDENMVVVETVECKPDFDDCGDDGGDDDRSAGGHDDADATTPGRGSEGSATAADDKTNVSVMSCESDDLRGERGRGDDDGRMDDDEEIAAERSESLRSDLNTVKAMTAPAETTTPSADDGLTVRSAGGVQLYECNVCWYFSTSKRDVRAHRQLHVRRSALYNCAQCAFNVTRSALLYHHYRYGHVVEEPELRYPEDAVVRAGQRDAVAKNDGGAAAADDGHRGKADDAAAVDDALGPPMVWTYNKDSVPAFAKVFKCRYCPHTNRRRHNTVEHERMHSDHPDHLHHRQQQQRANGGSSQVNAPLHPCKRCTYVCNNAGVLASHFKVHSASYGLATVGFYDSTMVDAMQVRTLEYIMELERNLMLDKDYGHSGRRTADGREPSSDSSDGESGGGSGQRDDGKYSELDEPELKFCPYCPARFFFRNDLRCHVRFHELSGGPHACDCCSFTARSDDHVAAHEIVHRDEYAQRTNELLASGYPVSRHYPRPAEYPASVGDDSSSTSRSSPGQQVDPDADAQRNRRAKRSRHSDGADDENAAEKNHEEFDEKTTKRPRRSSTVVAVAVKSGHGKPAPLRMLLPAPPPPPSQAANKTGVAMKSTVTVQQQQQQDNSKTLKAVAVKSTGGALVKTTKSGYVRQFTCDMCPGRFFKATALQYHRTLHGGPGQHKCRRCDYAVSTYGNLVRHEAVHKDLAPREKVKQAAAAVKAPQQKTGKGKTKIKTVPKTTTQPPPPPPTAVPLDGAEDDESAIDPEFGPSMLGNPAFYYPTTIKNGVSRPKRYKCAKCPSAFDKRDQYAVHLTLHGANDKYQCDKCDYSVRYTANYVQHQRKHAHDAEIRKNKEQAADRAKMIAEQEAASRAPRVRKRPNAAVQRSKPPAEPVEPAAPAVRLEPRDTVFTNEISDRQTAYELNAAYGPTTVVDVSGHSAALFRCTSCPFESHTRAELDRHEVHHRDVPPPPAAVATGPAPAAAKRTWRRACRFCTYRTHAIADLEEHTRVHFLRSTGVVLSSMAATALNGGVKDDEVDPDDHVEFHGKRVVYQQQQQQRNRDENVDENDRDGDAVAGDGDGDDDNDGVGEKDAKAEKDENAVDAVKIEKADDGTTEVVAAAAGDQDDGERPRDEEQRLKKEREEEEEEPFFVFKDCGARAGDNGRAKRFSPECQPPLFDVNDNRTGDAAKPRRDDKHHRQHQPTPTYVRFIDGGKRLEFLDDGPGGDAMDAGGKKKKTKK